MLVQGDLRCTREHIYGAARGGLQMNGYGGSIRLSAAFCGITGTNLLWPRPDGWRRATRVSLDHVGPMTRTAQTQLVAQRPIGAAGRVQL